MSADVPEKLFKTLQSSIWQRPHGHYNIIPDQGAKAEPWLLLLHLDPPLKLKINKFYLPPPSLRWIGRAPFIKPRSDRSAWKRNNFVELSKFCFTSNQNLVWQFLKAPQISVIACWWRHKIIVFTQSKTFVLRINIEYYLDVPRESHTHALRHLNLTPPERDLIKSFTWSRCVFFPGGSCKWTCAVRSQICCRKKKK